MLCAWKFLGSTSRTDSWEGPSKSSVSSWLSSIPPKGNLTIDPSERMKDVDSIWLSESATQTPVPYRICLPEFWPRSSSYDLFKWYKWEMIFNGYFEIELKGYLLDSPVSVVVFSSVSSLKWISIPLRHSWFSSDNNVKSLIFTILWSKWWQDKSNFLTTGWPESIDIDFDES